jgi:hypothetical protein
MATIITRFFASTPQRTAGATWTAIISILAPDKKSSAYAELEKVAGVASALIASEAPANDAIYVYGNGPQVRVYCLFGDDAVSGDAVNEDAFTEAPTQGDWRMSLPCPAEDLDWTQKKLKSLSSRVTSRAVGEDVEYEKTKTAQASTALVLDLKEFLKS